MKSPPPTGSGLDVQNFTWQHQNNAIGAGLKNKNVGSKTATNSLPPREKKSPRPIVSKSDQERILLGSLLRPSLKALKPFVS